MTGAPLFLRDLKDSLIRAELEQWKKDGWNDLIAAHNRGDDIEIGTYSNNPKIF